VLDIQDPEVARREEEMGAAAQNEIYAEDVAMLLAQQARIAQGARSFACPVKADLLALRCREWRDANDGPGTWFESYAAREPNDGPRRLPVLAKDGLLAKDGTTG
jgi:hypothetical protein